MFVCVRVDVRLALDLMLSTSQFVRLSVHQFVCYRTCKPDVLILMHSGTSGNVM